MFFAASKAPEFPPDFEWINTDEPLSLSKLRGNVIVLDFWTYCCINCMHTLPVLAGLERKYGDKPVVFIGVHSGKFLTEQEATNVRTAVSRYEIEHPVLVDKEMRVWGAFQVNAWPTVMVIDPSGVIVYKQAGEGQKEEIEDVIDILLQKHSQKGTLAREPPTIKNTKSAPRHLLSFPGKISISKSGKIAISDSNHNRILVTDLSGKIEHTVGNGMALLADGDFASASFFRPQGVAWDGNVLYVADTENHAIRRITFDDSQVVTVAGTGRQGHWMSTGGKGVSVSISSPWDVACRDGTVYIAMAGSHQIWTYDVQSQMVLPFAGTGQENIIDGPTRTAQLAQPSGIFVSGDAVYFADSEVSAVRKIDLGSKTVTTLVGHGLFEFGYQDGHVDDALFQHPLGLCVKDETVFVADTYNSAIRIISLKQSQVHTLIGKTEKNLVCMPDNPECDILPLYEPSDVEYHDNKLYITDTNNHLIRVFDLDKNTLHVLDVRK
ncbi:thioredoxin-like domain-containing protein [Candidatus Nitrosotenuis cloacae]|uniref:thioredoxin-like domain-containing protein n=1 Tax=Candidatus Nitrosotenuis cloacae TaxID=1603555 RepID=UPI0022825C67|nr:thioredoxin-like domain-containing protein [Candidatus Nitrosotenuis cloacae]